jgi:hypothetical protein
MPAGGKKPNARSAFTLIEVATALIILALVCSSVLTVMNRCMVSAANSAQKMQAFEVARENMEKLLCSNTVTEKVEYGSSYKYPDIQWQSTVESFYEPMTMRMWIRAVCSAQYTDADGQPQTVELTHWLTDVSKEQMLKMIQEMLNQLTEEQVLESIEEAAEYAGVDVETIEQWLTDGMRVVEGGEFDGFFIKSELDLYKRTGGNPSEEDRAAQVVKSKEGDKKEMENTGEENPKPPSDEETPVSKPDDGDEPPCVWVTTFCGMTDDEWRQLAENDIEACMRLLWQCKEYPVRECR